MKSSDPNGSCKYHRTVKAYCLERNSGHVYNKAPASLEMLRSHVRRQHKRVLSKSFLALLPPPHKPLVGPPIEISSLWSPVATYRHQHSCRQSWRAWSRVTRQRCPVVEILVPGMHLLTSRIHCSLILRSLRRGLALCGLPMLRIPLPSLLVASTAFLVSLGTFLKTLQAVGDRSVGSG